MTDEASEFLRDEMRGDCMAMIEHQEREIADLREQLAEKQELIEELDAQISEIQRDWRRQSRELLNEIAWLHSELHGAELDADYMRKGSKARRAYLMGVEDGWEEGEATGFMNGTDEISKLEAENTRLRSCLSDTEEHASMFLWENKQLIEERDKLRELLQVTGYYCGNGYCEPGDGCPLLVDGRCTLSERMRELGIEV